MRNLNASHTSHPGFILTGIPGMRDKNPWMAFPLGFLYTLTLLGNGTILAVVKVEQSLHEPILSTSTLPTMPRIFWFNAPEIPFDALSLAFNRFVIGLVVLIKRLHFCHSNVLSHSYCLHQDAMRPACASTSVNSLYSLIVVILTLGLDAFIILFSYVVILKMVLAIASRGERLKALNTCLSHICAVLLFYVPLIGVTMVHRFGKHLSPVVYMLMASIYLLLPAVLNPIIYSMKNKQI
uniref:G-protein coupled receptors family 1 profile domain-containing protein n=1 Tax=Nannospalax galili TaxID=1026970 RepID=A0A8C6RML7_NANGA